MKNYLHKSLSILLVLTLVLGLFSSLSFYSVAYSISGHCGNKEPNGQNVCYTFNTTTGELVISGSGAIKDYYWDDSPFYKQTSIKTLIINNGVTSIGDYAFSGCSGLTSIIISDSVTRIGDYAFSGCSGLTSITIPDSVTRISEGAFSGCSMLRSINMPNSVTFIGRRAFQGCISLTSITIPNLVNNIQYATFCDCSGLKELTIPASAYINNSEYTFLNCSNIEKVTLTKGTGTVLNYGTDSSESATKTYYQYTPWYLSRNSLKSLVLEDGITGIGSYAFYGCSKLKELTMPASAKIYNSQYTFYNCMNIEKVTLTKGTGTMQNYSLSTSESDTYFGYTPWYISRNMLKELVLEEGINNIGIFAFFGCSYLRSITIPDSVTGIGEKAFYECSNLTNVNFGNSLEIIEDFAFSGCKKLSRIDLPASIKSLGDRVFSGCLSVNEITLHKDIEYVPIKLVNGWYNEYFEGTFHGFATERINFIGTVEDWSKLPYCILSCGTISFNGEIYSNMELNEERINSYFLRGDENISSVSFSPSVTEIGLCAFNGCSHLTKITLPHSITISTQGYVGNDYPLNQDELLTKYAFSNSPISSITFNDNPTELTDKFHYLYKCETLKEFEVPNSVAYIGDRTFKECQNLTHVTIPKSVTRIEYNAFSGCTNLTIRGYKDSYADTFCKWAGIPFEVIEEPHIHSFAATVTAPTCTEQGFTTHTCSCGESYVDTYISALGHNTEAKTVVKPTGIQLGYTKHSCSRCGELQRVDTFTAPTGKLTLKCTARTKQAQTVSYNEVKNATGYQVQCSDGGTQWAQTKTGPKTSVTFKGLKAGINYKFRVRFYIKTAEGNKYSPWSTTLNSPTLPAGTAFTKVAAGSRSFAAQWKKQANATGYQIEYSTKSNFSGSKKVTFKSNKTLKTTVKKLSAKKVYYVRIRTYKTISKVNYFSTWSKAVKVKTK